MAVFLKVLGSAVGSNVLLWWSNGLSLSRHKISLSPPSTTTTTMMMMTTMMIMMVMMVMVMMRRRMRRMRK